MKRLLTILFFTITAYSYGQIPTATISGGGSICDDGSTTDLTIVFTGEGPWNVEINKSGLPFEMITSATSTTTISVSEVGIYSLSNVTDNQNVVGTVSGNATISKIPSIQATITTECNNGTPLGGITLAIYEFQVIITITEADLSSIQTLLFGASTLPATFHETSPASGIWYSSAIDEMDIVTVLIQDSNEACRSVTFPNISKRCTCPVSSEISIMDNYLCDGQTTHIEIHPYGSLGNYDISLVGPEPQQVLNTSANTVGFTVSQEGEYYARILGLNEACEVQTGSVTFVKYLQTINKTVNSTSCDSDTLDFTLEFTGAPPYVFNIERDGAIVKSITDLMENTYNYKTTTTGIYSIVDVNNEFCTNVSPIHFENGLHPKANLSILQNEICEGNTATELYIEINATDTIFMKLRDPENNIIDLKSITGQYVYQADKVGSYTLESVSDKNCTGVIYKNTIEVIQTDSLCGRIAGYHYMEEDGNCIKDANEIFSPFRQLKITPGDIYVNTGQNGQFDIPLGYGTYTISSISQSSEQISCTESHTFTLDNNTPTKENIIFTSNKTSDLSTNIHTGIFRPGFDITIHTYAYNRGSEEETLNMYLILPTELTINNTTLDYDRVSGDTLFWDDLTITGFQYRSVILNVNLPATTELGTILELESGVTLLDNESDYENNKFTTQKIVTGSYDPNDKTVLPKGEGQFGDIDISEDELLYRIRFQNTGTDTAFTVRITDTISPLLDLSTLELVGASHNYDFDIIAPGNVLQWTFNNILLVDSTTDEPNSHGSLYFKIAIKETKSLGDLISNSADIYFDYNLPIKTNTAYSRLGDLKTTTKLVHTSISNEQMTIYPNPTTEVIFVTLKNKSHDAYLKIFDVLGNNVFEQTLTTESTEIRVSQLPTGIYIVEVNQNGLIMNDRIVVK